MDIICETCKRNDFKSEKALVAHLSYYKSKCKTKIKDYYDKYLRKKDEGYCKICGKETSFTSIAKGYEFNICKNCKNKNPEYIKKQQKTKNKNRTKFKSTKLDENYHNFDIKCKICNRKFRTINGLSRHITQKHTIKPEKYFLEYLNGKINKCKVCGKNTNFDCLKKGYYKLHRNCSSKDIDVRKKIDKSFKKSYKNININVKILKYKNTINRRNKIKLLKIQLLNILRIISIDRNNKRQCQICGRIFENITKLSNHLKFHNINTKKYYDNFFKSDHEGICLISGMKTNFISLKNGYYKYYKSSYLKSDDIIKKNKKFQTNLLKNKILKYQTNFGIEINLDEVSKNKDIIPVRCLKCKNIYYNRWYNISLGYGRCPNCYPRNISKSESKLKLFIKSLNLEIIENSRDIINPLELDIYIPSKNIAIEFDGLYWHSDKFNKDKNYHLNKTEECEKNGIKLIHIFEDEWVLKQEIVKSRIKQILSLNNSIRIHARKCQIKKISPEIKNEFLNKFHIQGGDNSVIKLGAFYNDELVSIMTFSHGSISKGSKNIKNVWELNRFCSNSNYHIPGIASKLLTYFKRNYDWKEIFSYADRRWSNGNVYKQIGFELDSITKPNYWYIKGMEKVHRFGLRKKYNEPKDIPEWVLRAKEGYHRIWDCGHLKFIMK